MNSTTFFLKSGIAPTSNSISCIFAFAVTFIGTTPAKVESSIFSNPHERKICFCIAGKKIFPSSVTSSGSNPSWVTLILTVVSLILYFTPNRLKIVNKFTLILLN